MPSLGIHLNGKTYAWARELRDSGSQDHSIRARAKRFIAHIMRVGQRPGVMPPVDAAIPAIISVVPGQNVVDVSDHFSDEASAAVDFAYELASRFGHEQVEPLHLFIGSIEDENVSVVLERLGLTMDVLKESLDYRLQSRARGKPSRLSEAAQTVLMEAFRKTLERKSSRVSALEVFAASYQAEAFLREFLADRGIEEEHVWNMIEWLRIHEKACERFERLKEIERARNRRVSSQSATPLLDAVSEDFTVRARQGKLPMLIGREAEIQELLRVIESGRQSAVLVGAPGVGKSAMLMGVAELMIEGRVPAVLQEKRLVCLSVLRLVSGVSEQEAYARAASILAEVVRARNIILIVTDVEQLMNARASDEFDLASLFADVFSREATSFIATTTPEAYVESVENSTLGRILEKVDICEPDHRAAIHVLQSKIADLENEHQVLFTYGAVEKAVALSDRYIYETFLPKKAIEIARDAACLASKERGADALVSAQDIARVIHDKTGISLSMPVQNERIQPL